MQVRLSRQEADSLFFATVQFLQARDDFPDVRAGRERGAPVVRRAPEDDPGIVELVDPLDDELIQQRIGGSSQVFLAAPYMI